jgi:hypothetical protein
LSTITGLANAIKSVVDNDTNAIIKLRVNDTLPYAFWRLFLSTSKVGGAGSIDVFNKSKLQSFRVRFDHCKSDSICTEKTNQMMLKFQLWKDSILLDSSVVGQEWICICPPRTIQPDRRIKFKTPDSSKRYEYIFQSIENSRENIPVYFAIDPRLSLAEISKIMMPITKSICTQESQRKCYFNDLDYFIENSSSETLVNK